ncbi:MAG: autorepressor SdpR family transcription factor [Bernardetiaceae bacterium]
MKSIFKALDDPTRRHILDLLKDEDLTAGQIAAHFQMSKPSISYHLDLLRQADLVVSEKKGQYIYYSLHTSVLEEVIRWLIHLQEQNPSSTHGNQDHHP